MSKTRKQILRLMNLGDDYTALLLQGGARLQFAMLPMNFSRSDHSIDFAHTGYWTKIAIKEAEKTAKPNLIASSEDKNYAYLPTVKSNQLDPTASYLHYCANNTIEGTQWKEFTHLKEVPCVVDMSSDILSREIDYKQFDFIFAGAQKNLGPAGVTLVVLTKEWAERGREDIPDYLQYRTHIKNDSMYSTPPTFSIYVLQLVLDWIEAEGGMAMMQKRNAQKAELLYNKIDSSGLYQGIVKDKKDRSEMNVVFRLGNTDETLEKKFIESAEKAGIVGIKGHRIAGGIRVSLYNSISVEAVQRLVDFMTEFETQQS